MENSTNKNSNIDWQLLIEVLSNEKRVDDPQFVKWLQMTDENKELYSFLSSKYGEEDFVDKDRMFDNIAKALDLQPATKRKELTIGLRKLVGIAAAILLPILLTISYLAVSYTDTSEELLFTTHALPGEKSYVVLPDSTRVWLNSNSTLTYTSKFGRNGRTVKLVGEGYFEVQKSTDNKFVVELQDVDIVVHGTTFNVSNYPEESVIEVSLEEGKIAMVTHTNHTLLTDVSPNEKFIYTPNSQKWEIMDYDASISGIWHNGVMQFRYASVDEVFKKIEKWYGVNIKASNYDDSINYLFTIKSESLKEILDLINLITPIDYKIDGKEVTIVYK